MSDEKTEVQVGNIGITAWQQGLAQAVNSTYSYANTTYFISALPTYYKDYGWRYIRPACQWLDGFVPSIHSPESGIVSTRIAASLIKGLTKTIVGEKLIFKVKGSKDKNALETLKFISNWADQNNCKKAIKNAIGFALALGTSALKINKRANNTLWLEAVRFDNCFILANSSGEVSEATFLMRTYVDTRQDSNKAQFFLVEHRFYKNRVPKIKKVIDAATGVVSYETIQQKGVDAVVEYKVHRVAAQSMQNTMPNTTTKSTVGWTEIPQEIRKAIKNDYAVLRIDEPQLLGLPNLGVELLINDDGDISIPTGAYLGNSLIVQCQDDFLMYEIAESYAIRDMYNGKGTVYVPKSLSISAYSQGIPAIQFNEPPKVSDDIRSDGSTINAPYNPTANITAMNPLEGLDNKYEKLEGVDPADQSVIVEQFELRGDQWQMIQENALRRIAIKWGMSPKVLASFLAQGTVQMTATQIDSEDDISIAYINDKRATFIPTLNKLLETILNFYGHEVNVTINFASPSLINKDRILDRVTKKLQSGLCSLEDAIREINPDLDEETLQAKIDELKNLQQQQMLAAINEMNPDGSFGNNYDDLGGANLLGSTSPLQ